MKTLNLNLKSLVLVAIIGLAVFTVGCAKDDDKLAQPVASENAVLKEGKSLPPGENSIAAIAIGAGFTQLVSALQYVDGAVTPSPGLVNLFLNSTDQYTVFAPTDAAFEALYAALSTPEAPVTKISDLPAPLVLNVLLYHVTDGRRAANSVVPKNGSRKIATLLPGANFSVSPMGKITAVGNTANIVSPNITASNGLIHVIDNVLLPIK